MRVSIGLLAIGSLNQAINNIVCNSARPAHYAELRIRAVLIVACSIYFTRSEFLVQQDLSPVAVGQA